MANLLRAIGPGLLFAGTAIGTSHFVLSTRAGAHHGMIFFWIILLTLLLKYPFFEMAPRYVSATGKSLIEGYKEQGNWAVMLFLVIVFIDMFVVTAAVGAVCAGLCLAVFPLEWSIHALLFFILLVTVFILRWGRYRSLDQLIKWISVLLFLAILVIFVAVLFTGPIPPDPDFLATSITSGSGFVLLVSLIGWMPVGLEASAMHSIWIVEQQKAAPKALSLRERLFDFRLGYLFSAILAFLFLTIGAYTLYGSGQRLEGTPVAFSSALLQIFSGHLGAWSYPVLALTAFATLYGTLITAIDAFCRGFVQGFLLLNTKDSSTKQLASDRMEKLYNRFVVIIPVGAFLLFYTAGKGMIQFLELATIIAFVFAPILAWLNLRLFQNEAVDPNYKAGRVWQLVAYLGLAAMTAFAIYYLFTLFFPY